MVKNNFINISQDIFPSRIHNVTVISIQREPHIPGLCKKNAIIVSCTKNWMCIYFAWIPVATIGCNHSKWILLVRYILWTLHSQSRKQSWRPPSAQTDRKVRLIPVCKMLRALNITSTEIILTEIRWWMRFASEVNKSRITLLDNLFLLKLLFKFFFHFFSRLNFTLDIHLTLNSHISLNHCH